MKSAFHILIFYRKFESAYCDIVHDHQRQLIYLLIYFSAPNQHAAAVVACNKAVPIQKW